MSTDSRNKKRTALQHTRGATQAAGENIRRAYADHGAIGAAGAGVANAAMPILGYAQDLGHSLSTVGSEFARGFRGDAPARPSPTPARPSPTPARPSPASTPSAIQSAQAPESSGKRPQIGYTSAPTVLRVDQQGSNPEYTNVLGTPGGFGVSTIPGPSMDERLASMERASALRQGNQRLRDQIAFNTGAPGRRIGNGYYQGGGGSFRRMGEEEIMRNMLGSRSRTDRTLAAEYFGAQQEGSRQSAVEAQRLKAAQEERAAAREPTALARAQEGEVVARTEAITQGMGPQMRQRPTISREEITMLQDSPEEMEAARERLLYQQEAYDIAMEKLAPALAAGESIEKMLADPKLSPLVAQLFEFRRPMSFAEGGLVPGAVRGAGYGQTPNAGAVLPEINEYRQYAMGAQKLGLPAIPFEQFLTLRDGARQVGQAGTPPVQSFREGGFVHPRREMVEGQPRREQYSGPTYGTPSYPQETIPERPGTAPIAADRAPLGSGFLSGARSALQQLRDRPMSFAAGGAVPDASGKMVFDMDPNAPTDSIPAMIDGEQPAELDSGEFVFPREAVMFHGLDKLQKLIEQARQKG